MTIWLQIVFTVCAAVGAVTLAFAGTAVALSVWERYTCRRDARRNLDMRRSAERGER